MATSRPCKHRTLQSNDVSAFNAAGRLTSVTDRNGQATTFTYSGGKLTQITSDRGGANSRSAQVTNAYGYLSKIKQLADTTGNRSVDYTVNLSTFQLDSIVSAPGTTSFGWSGTTGDLSSVTDPSGLKTSFTYDSSHRVLSVTQGNTAGTGQQPTSRFSYPTSSQTLFAGPNTNQSQPITAVPHVTYTLDATDRPTGSTNELGYASGASYTPFYDVKSATDGNNATSSATYGANGGQSLTDVTSPTGATASLGYTNPGATAYIPSSGTDSQGSASTISVDGVGNITGVENADGATSWVTYNSDGTLATAVDPNNKTTTYTRDNTTKQITGITPPSGSGLGNTGFTYDKYSRLATVTDGRGVTRTYTYDDLDHVTKIAFSDSTPAITWTYNANGQPDSYTTNTHTTGFGYDVFGHVTSRTYGPASGLPTSTLTYGYDLAGNLTSSVDGAGTTTYTYDDANQPASMTAPGGLRTNFAYDHAGHRVDTWWKTNANTTWMAHTHTDLDSSGKIKQTWTARNSSDSTKAYDTSYCYTTYVSGQACPLSTSTSHPASGLIQWSVDNLTSTRTIYTYDKANRLTKAAGWGGHTYEYAYDANGNRKSVKVDGSTTQSLTYNSGNQITSTGYGYGYDQAGNRTSDPAAGTLGYDGDGHMASRTKSGTTTTYTYAGDGMNELTRQTTSGGGDSYDLIYGRNNIHGTPVLDTYTKNGVDNYVTSDPNGTPISMRATSNGTPHYYIPDGMGSVMGSINGTGAVSSTLTYDPFGTMLTQTGNAAITDVNPYRQQAGIDDPTTNWIRHGTRYYDTTTGAWTTVDPITRLTDPDRANAYAYAGGNPINYADPTGKDWWDDLWNTVLEAVGACGIGATTTLVTGIAEYAALLGPEGASLAVTSGCVVGPLELTLATG